MSNTDYNIQPIEESILLLIPLYTVFRWFILWLMGGIDLNTVLIRATVEKYLISTALDILWDLSRKMMITELKERNHQHILF